jgi:hypothetical protein
VTALEAPIPAALALDDEPFDETALDYALDVEADEASGFDVSGERLDDVHRISRWYPTDVGAAEWAMRKLADHQRNLDEITRQAAEWQSRIDAWHEAMTTKVSARASFFRVALIRWALDERERDPKGPATLTLPSGVVRTTSRKARPKVVDRAAAAVSAIHNLDDDDRAAVVEVPPQPQPVAKATELAKRVRIVERIAQRTFDLELAGGERAAVTILGDEEPPVEFTIDDGIDERVVAVEHAEEDEDARVVEQVVVWADTGQPVPGVVVEPARIDAAVEPA